MGKQWRIAIASLDGIVINEHFGRAKEFYIIDIHSDGTNQVSQIRAVPPLCNSGEHSELALSETIRALDDCTAVLVARIGMAAKRALEINKISVFEQPDYIESALTKITDYFIRTNALTRREQLTDTKQS